MSDILCDYPMNDPLPRRLIVAGAKKNGRLRGQLVKLSGVAQVKRGELTRRELTPPIQTDEERGQGDSVNARLHRILMKGEISK